jgi:predicted ATP-dependent serine protease
MLMQNSSNKLEFNYEKNKKFLAEQRINLFDHSRFDFLNDHFGLKPKCVHVLIGTSGTGKSTLARSVMVDTAMTCPVTIYSSEESKEIFSSSLHERKCGKEIVENFNFIHETDLLELLDCEDIENFKSVIKSSIIETNSKAFFMDNLTTSSFYEGMTPKHQSKFFKGLQEVANELNIPVFVIAHTRSGVKDSQQELIALDDIRGSKSVTNKADFVYCYQRFSVTLGDEDKLVPTVRILKARYGKTSQFIYCPKYDKWTNSYVDDYQIKFEDFKEIYSKRHKL